MDGCVFCAIASRRVPARVVWENDDVMAFDDTSPEAPVHTLIIPKRHHVDLADEIPDATLVALLRAVPTVAAIKGVERSGYRLIVNSGPDANQTVGHVHIHLIAGRAMSHGMVDFLGDR